MTLEVITDLTFTQGPDWWTVIENVPANKIQQLEILYTYIADINASGAETEIFWKNVF